MNEEVQKILLNEMPVVEFIAYYLASILGAFVWLFIKTIKAIYHDPDTPGTFKRKYMWRGIFKFIISLMILPWVIIYFTDYGPFILELMFKLPQENTHNHIGIELNGGSAFVLGLSIDAFIRKITDNQFKKITR